MGVGDVAGERGAGTQSPERRLSTRTFERLLELTHDDLEFVSVLTAVDAGGGTYRGLASLGELLRPHGRHLGRLAGRRLSGPSTLVTIASRSRYSTWSGRARAAVPRVERAVGMARNSAAVMASVWRVAVLP